MILLFIVPLSVIYYKQSVLKLSLLPQKLDDTWNFYISVKPVDPNDTSVSFPIPRLGVGLKVSDEKIKSKGLETIFDRNSDSVVLTWLSNEPIQTRLTYSASIDIEPVEPMNVKKDLSTSYPRPIRKYLKLPELSKEEAEGLSLLEQAIYEGNEDKASLARKAYYYVSEEIQRNTKYKTLMDALAIGRGTPLVKAKMYAYMLRRKGIPARIILKVSMPEKEDQADRKLPFTYSNEVFLNNRWVPVNTNRGEFGASADNFLILHRHFEEIEESVSRKKISFTIKASRAVLNKFNKQDFRKEIMKKSPVFGKMSLHRLPLPVQAIFATILLIPIGTLVLSFARNMLGVPTFGMFTPILLTVFFKETSLMFGLMFFIVVVLVGIFERYGLDRLRLLAIPRMSIILTLVILFLMIVAISGVAEIFGASHVGYFPIVIVTVFIERFSIMLTEDGVWNTTKTLIGTLVIAILTYLIYTIEALEMIVFTNPELLFVIMALLILIGKYKGYRLSEIIRFRNLINQLRTKQ